MLDFNEITVTIKEEEGNRGVYAISPLPRGYGHTLVNSLRRILLSSLRGSGITSVKVKGITHEYSTIEGVREDVLEILLNLKAVKFKCTADKPQICYLENKGKEVLTAGDIKVTQAVEVANKDLEIVHLSDEDTKISMELVVESGVGYKESKEDQRSEVGRIPLDCDFSPVVKVNPRIGTTRKGEETQLDSVMMEIVTDGSIEPKQALIDAAQILQDFSGKVMVSLGMAQEEVDEMAELSKQIEETEGSESGEISDEEADEEKSEILEWKIDELAISKRSKTALDKVGIEIVGELVELTKDDLLNVQGIGAKSAKELEEMLETYNLSLRKENEEE